MSLRSFNNDSVQYSIILDTSSILVEISNNSQDSINNALDENVNNNVDNTFNNVVSKSFNTIAN